MNRPKPLTTPASTGEEPEDHGKLRTLPFPSPSKSLAFSFSTHFGDGRWLGPHVMIFNGEERMGFGWNGIEDKRALVDVIHV
jgi:hypothetical protein